MIVTNHGLMKLRILSPLMATVFAIVVYIDVKQYIMFPLVLLQVASLIFAFKLKCKNGEQSLGVVTRGGLIFIVIAYGLAIAVGVFVSMTASKTAESVFLLLFYVVSLDALMTIPFVMSFTDQSKWQRVGSVPGVGNPALDGVSNRGVAAYADSDYNPVDYEIYGTQSDYHTNSFSDSYLGVNPASGLPMINDAMDVAGNVYGFGEPMFPSYDHDTNQFSDFDYHNNQ